LSIEKSPALSESYYTGGAIVCQFLFIVYRHIQFYPNHFSACKAKKVLTAQMNAHMLNSRKSKHLSVHLQGGAKFPTGGKAREPKG